MAKENKEKKQKATSFISIFKKADGGLVVKGEGDTLVSAKIQWGRGCALP